MSAVGGEVKKFEHFINTKLLPSSQNGLSFWYSRNRHQKNEVMMMLLFRSNDRFGCVMMCVGVLFIIVSFED